MSDSYLTNKLLMIKKAQVRSCGKYKSFFRLIDEFWLTRKQRRVAHRICTVMRQMNAESVVIEEVDDTYPNCMEVKAEKEAVTKRLGKKTTFKTYKVTFLDEAYPEAYENADAFDASRAKTRVLGYVVLINVIVERTPIRSYVFESVIIELGKRIGEKWVPLNDFYLHVKRDFECKLMGEDYTLRGSFFSQQNSITSVCAHVCMAMMLNNVDSPRIHVTCEDINVKLGIDHVTEKFRVEIPGIQIDNSGNTRSGLHAGDVKNIVESHGYKFFFREFGGLAKPRFREFLYGFIESGFPSLLSFKTGTNGHVVAAVGHTFNPNSWLPLAVKAYAGNGLTGDGSPTQTLRDTRYLSSLAWVDDFLVHDDNVGMELSLPAHAFHDVDHYVESIDFVPQFAVGILPQKFEIQILAHQVEHHVAQYLTRLVRNDDKYFTRSDNYYINHLLPHFDPKKRTVVLRASLVTTEAYVRHLKHGDNMENTIPEESIQKIENYFAKKHYWLIEVSEPDLYVGNTSKLIDVLVDPTIPAPVRGEPILPWYQNAIRILKFPDVFMAREGHSSVFNCIRLQTDAHHALYGLIPN